jgi:hypothetical protein
MAAAKRRSFRPAPAGGSGRARAGVDTRAAGAPSGVRLPRVPKGKRARFHADANVDRLFAIVTALTAELSVVSERLLTLERVLGARGVLRSDDIESHPIDEDEAAQRLQMREGLIERVFQVLETDD